MKITHTSKDYRQTQASDVLIIGVEKGAKDSNADATPRRTNIVAQARAEKFEGQAGKMVLHFSNHAPKWVILVGLGELAKLDMASLREAVMGAVGKARSLDAKSVTISILPDAETLPFSAVDFGQAIAEGAALGEYVATHQKTSVGGHKPEHRIDQLTVCHANAEVGAGVTKGAVVAEGVELTRELTNLPCNILTPPEFERRIKDICDLFPGLLSMKVWSKFDLEKLHAGGILAVSAGSAHDSRIVEVSMDFGTKTVFGPVGKGITFDSGGLNLKPGASQENMHMDMGGAGVVIGAMLVAAKLGIKLSTKAYFPIAENMTGDAAYKCNDILTMMSGQTVEVLNTDAEGRLVLADALTLGQNRGITHAVTVATLTGAAITVVGDAAACVLGNNETFLNLALASAAEVGEDLQPLKLFPKVAKYLDSKVADMSNISRKSGAGTAVAYSFLTRYIKDDRPFVHFDTAPVAWNASGASGFLVCTLVRMMEKLAAEEKAAA